MSLQQRRGVTGNRECSIAPIAAVAMPHSPFPIPRSPLPRSPAP